MSDDIAAGARDNHVARRDLRQQGGRGAFGGLLHRVSGAKLNANVTSRDCWDMLVAIIVHFETFPSNQIWPALFASKSRARL